MGRCSGLAHRARRWVRPLAVTPLPRVVYRLRRLWQAVARPMTVGAQALVVDLEGRVLLVHHSYLDGWHLPGGRVNKGETAAAGAVRELWEETGLKAMGSPRLLGLYGRFNHGGSDHIAVYVVDRWTGALAVDGLEVDGARFCLLDALPPDVAPATRRRLAEYRGLAQPTESW